MKNTPIKIGITGVFGLFINITLSQTLENFFR